MLDRRPTTLHILSAASAAQPLYRTARVFAGGSAGEHGRSRRPGSRTLSEIRRRARERGGCRARAGRCGLHPLLLVASRPLARLVQYAHQLLVERWCCGGSGRVAVRSADVGTAHDSRHAELAAGRVASDLRSRCVLARRRSRGPPPARTPWRARPADASATQSHQIGPGTLAQPELIRADAGPVQPAAQCRAMNAPCGIADSAAARIAARTFASVASSTLRSTSSARKSYRCGITSNPAYIVSQLAGSNDSSAYIAMWPRFLNNAILCANVSGMLMAEHMRHST